MGLIDRSKLAGSLLMPLHTGLVTHVLSTTRYSIVVLQFLSPEDFQPVTYRMYMLRRIKILSKASLSTPTHACATPRTLKCIRLIPTDPERNPINIFVRWQGLAQSEAAQGEIARNAQSTNAQNTFAHKAKAHNTNSQSINTHSRLFVYIHRQALRTSRSWTSR